MVLFLKTYTPLRVVKNPSVLLLLHNLSMGGRCIHPSILKIFPYCCHIQWHSLGNSCPTQISLSISPTQKCERNSFKTKSLPPFFVLLPSPLTPSSIFPLLFLGNCIGFWSDSYPHPYLSKICLFSHIFSTPHCQSHKTAMENSRFLPQSTEGLSHTILRAYIH